MVSPGAAGNAASSSAMRCVPLATLAFADGGRLTGISAGAAESRDAVARWNTVTYVDWTSRADSQGWC